jgi:ABC-type antimicrobial peptide transport system permease subunit
MNIVIYFLYAMMLLTVLVSAIVTYRLILSERAKEMGIMSVIGFSSRDLRMVLWTEIVILGLCSLSLGFVLARIMSWAVSFVSFSWFPGFEIFLNNGRLIALYLPGTVLINIALLALILFSLAIIPSLRVSRKELPALLAGEL